jgi:hypothetical protein
MFHDSSFAAHDYRRSHAEISVRYRTETGLFSGYLLSHCAFAHWTGGSGMSLLAILGVVLIVLVVLAILR